MAQPLDNVKLRIISRAAPGIHQGRKTEFGLQDKKSLLLAGSPTRGKLKFQIDVLVLKNEKTGLPRFRGSYVHNGQQGAQHLYLGWRYEGETSWINRLKVHLMQDWEMVAGAVENGLIMEVDATAPEWGVLVNWHGLKVGQQWHVKSR